MKKLLVLALLLMSVANFAQDDWYYDEASGLYATSDGYYYYFYEPYSDFYFAYDPSMDMYYYFDAASGMFYPYGTADAGYTSYDDYSGSYDTSETMSESNYNAMMNAMNEDYVSSMNTYEGLDGVADYNYYTDDGNLHYDDDSDSYDY